MAETFQGRDAVELAAVERSGFTESRHLGSAALVSGDGTLLAELGDVHAPVFPRSTLKPFQAMASLAAGAELSEEQLVVACASHGGTPGHVALVREILDACGLDDRDLGCPPDWPLDRSARDGLVRAGEPQNPVYMNCSGKHAAFLAACRASGWPLEGYLEPEHPLQQLVRETVERATSTRPLAVGVDGCGAPVYALPLLALARGVARLRTANAASPFALFRNAARISAAILRHGWVLDGPGRPNTLVIDELGVLAKTGAEGVLVMAAPDGTSLAIKMLDGDPRAATLVGLQLLVATGSLEVDAVQRLLPRLQLEVLGAGVPVGAIRVGADVPTRILTGPVEPAAS
ncbi:MAG: asparaginase [Pseudoclavibacter sp.]|nr:asparaginase [Pseudoclavibacter sp.]